MRDTRPIPLVVRNVVSGLCVLLLVLFPGGAVMFAQDAQYPGADPQYQGPPPTQPGAPSAQGQILTPDQISNLVAPIALYPDNLLSQVLAASTYPLEVVEAAQWLQQNRNLTGQQLIDVARQQNWDPSIQAMVVFPDVLNRLASDVQWTTALGNAYLAQQADVIAAVQRLRAEAQASGKLNSTAQQQVTTQTQDGQSAIAIVPTNPQVIYVPVYNPEYVWGPPVWGFYPPLYYPAFGFGFGFGPGIFLSGFFPGFGLGFGFGWGWGCNWFGGGIFARPFFFNHYGFHPGWGGWHGGAWAHVPEHRMGVPYANHAVASRFGGNFDARGGLGRAGAERGFANGAGARGNGFSRGNGFNGSQSFAPGNRGAAGNWQHFNQPGAGARGTQPGFHSNAPAGGGFHSTAPIGGGSRPTGPMGGANGFRSGGSNAFHGMPSAPSAPTFRSAPPAGGNFNGRSFSAPGTFGGGSSAPRSFSPAPRSFGGGSPAPRSFGSGSPAPRSFGGGSARSFEGGGGGGGFHGGGGGGGFHGGGGGGHGGRR